MRVMLHVDGVELLKGYHGSNLYTISVEDMMKSSPICLLSKASKNKSWSWHRRLNHLNFSTINDLAKKDLVRGLPRLKFEKDHLCSACQLGKSKKYTHIPKSENTIMEVLHTLHMDLCGPIRVQSINGKRYILVIVDDYSRFTRVKFLRSKDETPEFVIKFLKQIQVGLYKTVRFIRTDNGTEFIPTLVEAAWTMVIFSKTLMFLWIKLLLLLVTPKTVFGALCYPTNDSEDLGKLKAKADIGIFIGYAPNRKVQVPVVLAGVTAGPTFKDNPFAQANNDPFVNPFALEPSSEKSSSGDVSTTESNQVIQPHDHLKKWTKHYPMDNVIGNPSRPACIPIGKSNLLMDLQKMQKNPIFRILVDILQNTNFFRAFTASADVPSIYVQQFWNTLGKDTKTGVYSFQLDELWFNLNADLLHNALEITPKDSAHPFVPRPASDLIIDFVKGLDYLGDIQYISMMHVNSLHHPWRIVLSMINQCLIGKTSSIDKPRHAVLQMLWDDYPLNYLKFVSKGEVDEIFGMPIPKDLIIDAIRNSDYYKKYLEMAARKPRQPTTMTGEEVGKKKKAPQAGKSKQPAPAKQPKPAEKKTSKPTPSKKIHKGKRSDHLVDEKDEESQPASEPQMEDDEYNLQRGIQMSLESLQAQGQERQDLSTEWPFVNLTQGSPKNSQLLKARGKDASTGPSTQPQDDTSANVVHDTPSPADYINDAETIADMEQSNSETDTEILNVEEEHDPGKTLESRPPLARELMEEDQAGSNPRQSHVAQAGPNPEPMHEDFIATVCPIVHESLKLTKEEPGKANVETEVESMVTVPIHQASSSVPPLSTPIIDLSPPKPVSPPVKEPIITATTVTTTILPPPPPPPPQSTTDPDLATRVSTLEKRSADMFENGSYRPHPDHTTLYEALEASMQYPPPPPPKDSDQSKKKKHDSDAFTSKQPPLVNDDPMPEDMHLSESEDTDVAHLPKIKTRPDWLKPLPEEETPETPEPDWVIPPNDLPETENNCDDALAKSYKIPEVKISYFGKTAEI
ncbi:integrase, catalytic region, zinc finger, CCHC-type containing protein [Tanacetum coccineum]|uniref:Integrase, catalytic region, zinc finger, CCHC-type containing protein n=1 Tax=Tanacetum coccineum TaxID=301880 RepID=A0ABQ5FL03_9ASTR